MSALGALDRVEHFVQLLPVAFGPDVAHLALDLAQHLAATVLEHLLQFGIARRCCFRPITLVRFMTTCSSSAYAALLGSMPFDACPEANALPIWLRRDRATE